MDVSSSSTAAAWSSAARCPNAIFCVASHNTNHCTTESPKVCVFVRARVDVLALDKDETHDVEVSLDQDAGLLRMLITISDTRLMDRHKSIVGPAPCQRRPADHFAALVKYSVCYFLL